MNHGKVRRTVISSSTAPWPQGGALDERKLRERIAIDDWEPLRLGLQRHRPRWPLIGIGQINLFGVFPNCRDGLLRHEPHAGQTVGVADRTLDIKENGNYSAFRHHDCDESGFY